MKLQELANWNVAGRGGYRNRPVFLTPNGTKAKVQIVYQPLEGLHEACPKHPGDWYFSGDYPTPGGVKLLNKAFIDYIEQVYQF